MSDDIGRTVTVPYKTWKAVEQQLAAANRRIEVLEIMDMTATAKQWEMGMKHEKARAEAAEAEVKRMVEALDGMARAPYGEYQAMHDRAEAAETARDALIGERDELLADNNRYREALEQIWDREGDPIARAALDRQEQR